MVRDTGNMHRSCRVKIVRLNDGCGLKGKKYLFNLLKEGGNNLGMMIEPVIS